MDQVAEVRERTDIVALITEYVPLKKAGRNFKANCPFHQESSPSFFVSPDRQMFHCFGCQKGGDAYTFLMEYEHMEFPEALRFLAKKAGIALVETGRASVTISKKETLFRINSYAAEFYHYLLTSHPIGKEALSYLENRNVNQGTMKTFKIGFAPKNGTSLITYLTKKKSVSIEDILEVGLGVRVGSRVIDFFRGRLMFPLIDHRDNIVGFSGRIVIEDDNGPKYINTRDTLLYHKGEHFFGFNIAKEKMRTEDTALVVEGEFDVIACFQEGITNAIALKGTALTERQVNLLSRFVAKVVMCLDDDQAGQTAIVRSLPLLEKKSLHVSAVSIPHGKDPYDAIRENSGEFKKALKNDIPIYDYMLDRALSQFDKKNAEGKRSIVDFLIPLFAGIENEVIKEHYIRKLGQELDTTYESLLKEVERKQNKEREDKVYIPKSEKKPREERLEEYLLSLLIQSEKPQELVSISDEILGKHIGASRAALKILHLLFLYFRKNTLFDSPSFERDLPHELLETYNKAYLMPLSPFQDETYYKKEVMVVSKELLQLILKAKLKSIAAQIKAEEKGDNSEKEIHRLQVEFSDITALLKKP